MTLKVSVRIAPICVTDEVETWHKINRINVVENGTTPFNWHDLWLFQIFNWVQQRQKYTFRAPRNLNCLNVSNVIGNFNMEMSNKYYHYKFHLMLPENGYFDNSNVFYSIFTFNVLFYTLFNYRNAAASITERKIHESVSNILSSSKISKNKISEPKYQCVDYFNVLLNNFKILYHSISWEKTNWRHKKQNTRKILTSSWIITVICRDFFV